MDVRNIPAGAKLEMYVSPDCPYCAAAREYYDSCGVKYLLHDAENSERERADMFAFTGGDPTVPAIVIDGKYVQSGWGEPPRG